VEADDAEENELSLEHGAATNDDRPRFARVTADLCQWSPADWRFLSSTMSLGILSSRDWGHHLVEDILVETDSALYKAKVEDRNCVSLAKPPVLSDVPFKQIR
jgi:GGDEF domain-containing protein